MNRYSVAWVSALALCCGSMVVAQSGGHEKLPEETETGIPVTDPLVIEKCGACHARDEKGVMSRISFARTTPEGWSQAIKRMVRQNGLVLEPGEARAIVKYLATSHGLAPEEAKPVMYLAERRVVDETNIPNDQVRTACASCHSFAQPLSWRRSKADWRLLQNLHVALYSQADAQFRRTERGGPGDGAPDEDGPAKKKPVEVAQEYLVKTAPLHTPEWAAWQPRIREARLAGRWLVSASRPGHGRYVGELTIAPGPVADEFMTNVTLRSLSDGSVLKRSGTGLVYAGYSWRGQSSGGGRSAKPDDGGSAAREVMWFAPDQSSAEGRWFWGQYQEFGFDVTLRRATPAPTVTGVWPLAIKAGTSGAKLRIFGDGLAAASPADLDLGKGITVRSIVARTPGELVAEVDVAPTALSGRRDIDLKGAVMESAFSVYHRIDRLKVTPETALSRLGSSFHPKGYSQFDALGYENGPDGKPETADDLLVGPVDVDWSIQEFMTVYNDDDRHFVGTLSPTALFTPAADGPNPKRKFGRNNYGEVWVQATARAEKDRYGKPLMGRAYLVVTVPAYLQWDQPEVTR